MMFTSCFLTYATKTRGREKNGQTGALKRSGKLYSDLLLEIVFRPFTDNDGR